MTKNIVSIQIENRRGRKRHGARNGMEGGDDERVQSRAVPGSRIEGDGNEESIIVHSRMKGGVCVTKHWVQQLDCEGGGDEEYHRAQSS